tara:strand:+ start:5828 stop:6193 length:366 start_codon:yes stop_codon:yes gene_type:complete
MIKISTRLVFLVFNIAIKIPLSYRGYLQGKNEKKIWLKYSKTKFLGTFYFEFLGVVVMKRYKPINITPHERVKKLKSTIPEFNFLNCDLYNCQNWGVERSKYYLIDYGINEKISKMYKNKN